MLIHVGSSKTLRTGCGKSVAGRWWVSRTTTVAVTYGPVVASKKIRARRRDVSCPDCLKTM